MEQVQITLDGEAQRAFDSGGYTKMETKKLQETVNQLRRDINRFYDDEEDSIGYITALRDLMEQELEERYEAKCREEDEYANMTKEQLHNELKRLEEEQDNRWWVHHYKNIQLELEYREQHELFERKAFTEMNHLYLEKLYDRLRSSDERKGLIEQEMRRREEDYLAHSTEYLEWEASPIQTCAEAWPDRADELNEKLKQINQELERRRLADIQDPYDFCYRREFTYLNCNCSLCRCYCPGCSG